MPNTLNDIFAHLDNAKASRAYEANQERRRKVEEAEHERKVKQAAESAVEKYHVYDDDYDVEDVEEPLVMIPKQNPGTPEAKAATMPASKKDMDDIADNNPFVQNLFKHSHKQVKQERPAREKPAADKNADKSSIPAVGGSFSVTGNVAEDTSFTEQAAVTPSTALTSDGRRWAMGASNVLIQAEDGTGAVVPVDAAETFQYDGKSLSFEKDGATYILRMVADSYTGAAQYAEEQTDESFTVSGMRFAGNGQELVVVGTRSAGDEEGNAAVRTAVADMLEKAVPAQGSGNITLNGVAVTADGCEASFSNGLALIKSGDGEVKFTPSSYDSETIAFDDAGTTASGAAVTHSDYANVNDTEAYLIESDEGNVMAFTNNADLLTSVLGLQ